MLFYTLESLPLNTDIKGIYALSKEILKSTKTTKARILLPKTHFSYLHTYMVTKINNLATVWG